MENQASEINMSGTDIEQALTGIIKAISMEQEAITNMINSQNEVIQKVKNSADVNELVHFNKSVNYLMKNIVRLQILLQIKLEESQEFLQEYVNFDYEE